MDILTSIVKNLDPHLSLILVNNYLCTIKEESMVKALILLKLNLLSKTQCSEEYENCYLETSKQLNVKGCYDEKLSGYHQTCEFINNFTSQHSALLNVLSNPDFVKTFNRQDHTQNIHLLLKESKCDKLPENFIHSLFDYAKAIYETGNYSGSLQLLTALLYFIPASDTHLVLNALWGSLSTCILLGNWETAHELLYQINEFLNQHKSMVSSSSTSSKEKKTIGTLSYVNLLLNRKWLCHWGLFVFFHHPNGSNLAAEFYLQSSIIHALQASCPHLIRYWICFMLMSRRRKQYLRETIKVLPLFDSTTNPFVALINAAFIEYEFDSIPSLLLKCEQMLSTDYFLANFRDSFMEAIRLSIFEIYCKFHRSLNMRSLANRLCLNAEDAEKWLVKLIRQTKLDAKIDSEKNVLSVGPNIPSVYQQVIDKTKTISYRTQLVVNQLGARNLINAPICPTLRKD